MATMNVSLPDAMKEWVEQQVETGRYANSSDVVRDLVRKEQERARQQADFDRVVAEALDSPRHSYTKDELLDLVMKRAEAAIAKREKR
ncbi:type II toxin-antitoxin system ParD family antitoxin [Devosia sp. XJ19-1]|uniref:Type II toxin-antitoxin system ParD family antitoxin n=1 Tax=Devosia ureilytica TaxID=2952754 RepID=A0A9Q4AR05_9HYPH|nr:type II toxin-antitoxin system ParD family antitoxin [Devosia ureilytica]MCP8884531.1 type II toxin-antitoxin system ParD family antitoxin [Devosia ureilytica]MCP8888161.1 type II toxin-antitoxin system ParD family antitoxin [Devosia ureilytica]